MFLISLVFTAIIWIYYSFFKEVTFDAEQLEYDYKEPLTIGDIFLLIGSLMVLSLCLGLAVGS